MEQVRLARDGQEFGPYDLDGLLRHLEEGSVLLDDLVWTEGADDWVPLEDFLQARGYGIEFEALPVHDTPPPLPPPLPESAPMAAAPHAPATPPLVAGAPPPGYRPAAEVLAKKPANYGLEVMLVFFGLLGAGIFLFLHLGEKNARADFDRAARDYDGRIVEYKLGRGRDGPPPRLLVEWNPPGSGSRKKSTFDVTVEFLHSKVDVIGREVKDSTVTVRHHSREPGRAYLVGSPPPGSMHWIWAVTSAAIGVCLFLGCLLARAIGWR